MTPRRRPKYGKVYSDRECQHPDCHTRFTPTGPNARYCDPHSEQRMRDRRYWKDLARRRQGRQDVAARCACCGLPEGNCCNTQSSRWRDSVDTVTVRAPELVSRDA